MPGTIPWDAIAATQAGSTLLKFGRHGAPHYRVVVVSPDCRTLSWYSQKKKNQADCTGEAFGGRQGKARVRLKA